MNQFSKTNLESLIGQSVSLKDEHDNTTTLTVKSVEENDLGNDKFESFTVHYSGKEASPIGDGCYLIEHEQIGSNQLFICANSPGEYETVITREKA